jgi:hypothetical protein
MGGQHSSTEVHSTSVLYLSTASQPQRTPYDGCAGPWVGACILLPLPCPYCLFACCWQYSSASVQQYSSTAVLVHCCTALYLSFRAARIGGDAVGPLVHSTPPPSCTHAAILHAAGSTAVHQDSSTAVLVHYCTAPCTTFGARTRIGEAVNTPPSLLHHTFLSPHPPPLLLPDCTTTHAPHILPLTSPSSPTHTCAAAGHGLDAAVMMEGGAGAWSAIISHQSAVISLQQLLLVAVL